MTELLTWLYPWMKTLHIISVMSWMAGLLYLPRLMVYHTENAIIGGEMDATFQVMEHRLYQYIMTPAMVATWLFGILLSLTPYVIDWQQIWPWVKLLSIILLTGFHHWLGARSKDFVHGKNRISGRQFRLLNEVPTILMIIIVASVVVKY
ncbi:MAG: protoporphyrinogen oxidase HemJ [Paracoccaceae bacterium]